MPVGVGVGVGVETESVTVALAGVLDRLQKRHKINAEAGLITL